MLQLTSSYILVNDMDRSVEFYTKLFGVKPTIITPDRWIQFDFDGNKLAICNQLYDLKTVVAGGDIDKTYSKAYLSRLSKHRTIFGNNVVHQFQADDLNKEYSRVSKIHGGIISDIMYINVSSPYSFFTVTDPDGNVIEIFGEYAIAGQQEAEVNPSVADKIPAAVPAVEKIVAEVPVPKERPIFKPIPVQQPPVETIPEKPVTAVTVEKPSAPSPAPAQPVEEAPEPPKPEVTETPKPEKPEPKEAPKPEKTEAAEPAAPKAEIPSSAVDKSIKDKSILKAAIEKEKEKEKEAKSVSPAPESVERTSTKEEKSDDQPVFISPNWEEIADRLKKTVIEKTSRPVPVEKEKEKEKEKEIPSTRQAEAEPVKKAGERPGLRPIIAEDKPMVIGDSSDDAPVMIPIWEESYGKNKKPVIEKNQSAAPVPKEPEPKADKADETPHRKSSVKEDKLPEPAPEPEAKKIDVSDDLPPIVAKSIRNAAAKAAESKPEKNSVEKPIFKPMPKDKEKELEKELKKSDKPVNESDSPAEEPEKPVPLPPPIWEKPTGDLWGDERK